MNISLNWLRDYVDWKSDTSTLAETLTFAGVEVEGIETRGAAIDKVVVAQILSSERHPNADRLSVCRVNDGSEQQRQIVCGAKNYKVGDKVPLALPGAILPGDFKIKVGKLRGVESEGMLCSAKELSLAEEAEGLLILAPDAPVGRPISEVFPPETVFELEVTPNRPDLLSHVGLAREVATLGNISWSAPKIALQPKTEGESVSVALESENCPYYTAQLIRGVKVGQSPDWLKRKLESVGLRPINNIVDITNFVLLELGQPLHAFDADKLRGGIRARQAQAGEKFLALDGREYDLNAEDLVIADDARAVAIAGVMGGEDTGVTETTTNVLLESAFFVPQAVRRTSRRLGLMSDSSYRFERRVDPAGVLPASMRATQLILEIAGGTLVGSGAAGGVAAAPREVRLRYARCNTLIGANVPRERVDAILAGFGLVVQSSNAEETVWLAPSFRPDLEREVDLIEEVCRVCGMDRIESRTVAWFSPSSTVDRRYDTEMQVRRRLSGAGFSEIKTVTLISEQALQDDFFSGRGERVKVRNPLSEDQVLLRPSLSPGLVAVVERNIRQGLRNLRLFEVGRVFGGETEEARRLGIAWTGDVAEATWRNPEAAGDFFDLKGAIEALLGQTVDLVKTEDQRLALAFDVQSQGKPLGRVGQVWPARARELDLRAPLFLAELEIEKVEQMLSGETKITPLPKFPAVARDVAMLVPERVTHAEIAGVMRGANEPLLIDVEVFDIFTDPAGEKVPAGHKSMAYSLTFRSPERTLTTEEVNAAHERIKKAVAGAISVTFR